MKPTTWIFLCGILTAPAAIANDKTAYVGSSEWQQRRLFEPTPNELQQEAAGRILIYDGLTETDLDRALDGEFQRIESMMFIRTKKKTPEGEPLAYDDEDC
jgi:hypothetical protein